jgi:leader peptidase (prepilin peptidase)/N-methyltransferase
MSTFEANEDVQASEDDEVSLRPNLYLLAFGSTAIALLSFLFLPWTDAVFSTLLGGLMIAGADVDARTFLLPDIVTYGALAVGLAYAWSTGGQEAWASVFAALSQAIAVAATLLCLRAAYQWLRGQEGLGLGDVKLGAAIGAWLPFNLTPLCFAVASIAALGFVLVRGGGLAAKRGLKLPFGAFLCPALWLIFFMNALPSWS